MNLHNHCFSEAVARTHTEDGAGRKSNESIVYTVLLPLSKRGIEILTPAERLDIARLGILQLLKGGATTVMEPFRNGIPEMFDAALEMGIRFYGAPYLFSKRRPEGRIGRASCAMAQSQSGGDDGAADLDRWNALHAAMAGRDEGRIRLAMSPHATDTCDPDLLRRRCGAGAGARRADHHPSRAEQGRGRDDPQPLWRSHADAISRLARAARPRPAGGALHRAAPTPISS